MEKTWLLGLMTVLLASFVSAEVGSGCMMGWSGGTMWGLGGIIPLLVIIVLILLIFWLFKQVTKKK